MGLCTQPTPSFKNLRCFQQQRVPKLQLLSASGQIQMPSVQASMPPLNRNPWHCSGRLNPDGLDLQLSRDAWNFKLQEVNYGSSNPPGSSHQNSRDLWMFISPYLPVRHSHSCSPPWRYNGAPPNHRWLPLVQHPLR